MISTKDHGRTIGRGNAALGAALLLAAACAPHMSVESGGTRQPSLAKKPYPVDCDTAHRYAARALKARQYSITEVNRSAAGGVVVGVKDGQTTEMTVTCSGEGSFVEASGGGSWIEQGLQFSFHQVVEKGDGFWPPPKSPRVKVDKIEGPESKLWFSREIGSSGLTAVRVRILNGGKRALRLDPGRITAVGSGGGGARALSEADVKARLGSDATIERQILRAVTLEPGGETVGFVFFPAAPYTGANVQLVDVPTGEADGYDVSFAEGG
jgi:hypothetical protein